jgi:hypothetical protein
VQSAAQGEDPLTGIVQHLGSPIAAVRVTHAAGGAALAALAVAVAGIRINAWYGGTLGRTPEASTLLSGLSVSADVLALILPTSASARTYDPDRGKTTQVIQRGRLPTHEPLQFDHSGHTGRHPSSATVFQWHKNCIVLHKGGDWICHC